RNTRCQASLYQKQKGSQSSGLQIKPAFQKFIGSINLQLIIYRYERNRENDHRDRQAKIKLNKAHAIRISLSWRTQEGDGGCLRGHYGKANGPPIVIASFEIALQILAATGFVHPINYNEEDSAE